MNPKLIFFGILTILSIIPKSKTILSPTKPYSISIELTISGQKHLINSLVELPELLQITTPPKVILFIANQTIIHEVNCLESNLSIS